MNQVYITRGIFGTLAFGALALYLLVLTIHG